MNFKQRVQGDVGRRQLGNNETACLQHRHISAERVAHGEALTRFGESVQEGLAPKCLHLQHQEHAELWFSCASKWGGSHEWSAVVEGYRLLSISWEERRRICCLCVRAAAMCRV